MLIEQLADALFLAFLRNDEVHGVALGFPGGDLLKELPPRILLGLEPLVRELTFLGVGAVVRERFRVPRLLGLRVVEQLADQVEVADPEELRHGQGQFLQQG